MQPLPCPLSLNYTCFTLQTKSKDVKRDRVICHQGGQQLYVFNQVETKKEMGVHDVD